MLTADVNETSHVSFGSIGFEFYRSYVLFHFVTLRDNIRNEDLRGRIGVNDVVEIISRLKWHWAR